MIVELTKHADERRIARGVSIEEIMSAITRGSKRRQNGKWVATHGYLTVVYIKKKLGVRIITVMVGE